MRRRVLRRSRSCFTRAFDVGAIPGDRLPYSLIAGRCRCFPLRGEGASVLLIWQGYTAGRVILLYYTLYM